MSDLSVTDAVLAKELPRLIRLGELLGWKIGIEPPSVISIGMRQQKTGDCYILCADVTGYKSFPPAWTFADPASGAVGTLSAFPTQPTPAPGGGSGIFIMHNSRPIICLPCNRLAYSANGGPHGDWPLAGWMNVTPQFTTLVEMAGRIHTELQTSPGPWGPRPT